MRTDICTHYPMIAVASSCSSVIQIPRFHAKHAGRVGSGAIFLGRRISPCALSREGGSHNVGTKPTGSDPKGPPNTQKQKRQMTPAGYGVLSPQTAKWD